MNWLSRRRLHNENNDNKINFNVSQFLCLGYIGLRLACDALTTPFFTFSCGLRRGSYDVPTNLRLPTICVALSVLLQSLKIVRP